MKKIVIKVEISLTTEDTLNISDLLKEVEDNAKQFCETIPSGYGLGNHTLSVSLKEKN